MLHASNQQHLYLQHHRILPTMLQNSLDGLKNRGHFAADPHQTQGDTDSATPQHPIRFKRKQPTHSVNQTVTTAWSEQQNIGTYIEIRITLYKHLF